jgi:hypothetical protein
MTSNNPRQIKKSSKPAQEECPYHGPENSAEEFVGIHFELSRSDGSPASGFTTN